MANAAAGVIIQISWERLLAAFVAGLLGIYAALRRATSWTPVPAFEDGGGPA